MNRVLSLSRLLPNKPIAAVASLLAAVALGRLAARDAGWHRDGTTLTLRWRTVGRRTVLASERRLQRAASTTNPFQRRAGLATFAVRLSSRRGARIRHLHSGVAHELLAATADRAAHPHR